MTTYSVCCLDWFIKMIEVTTTTTHWFNADTYYLHRRDFSLLYTHTYYVVRVYSEVIKPTDTLVYCIHTYNVWSEYVSVVPTLTRLSLLHTHI